MISYKNSFLSNVTYKSEKLRHMKIKAKATERN